MGGGRVEMRVVVFVVRVVPFVVRIVFWGFDVVEVRLRGFKVV